MATFAKIKFCLCLCLFMTHGLLHGAATRDIQVVVVAGNFFPKFSAAPILSNNNELFLYSYDDGAGVWRQIPFQFDERRANNKYVYSNVYGKSSTPADLVADETPGLDDNDELVFLHADAGDKNFVSWISDAGSVKYPRYEVCVIDPLTKAARYVYLYRSATIKLDPGLSGYVKYIAATSSKPTEDGIESQFYTIRHRQSGLPESLSIPVSAGGNGNNLIDRMKVRAKIPLGFSSVDVDEDDILFKDSEDDKLFVKPGTVRVIRKAEVSLQVDLGFFSTIIELTYPPFFYNPYNTVLAVTVPDAGIIVKSGRFSMDLDPLVSGMNFVSGNNPEPGFVVDGKPDANFNRKLDTLLPDNNWIFINGIAQGSLVFLFPLSPNTGGSRELYYLDNGSSNSKDTGDRRSFADVGVKLEDGVNTPFTLSYNGYYLDGKQTSDVGAAIAEFERTPLNQVIEEQKLGAVPVELIAFFGYSDKRNVTLEWETALENNNFGFAVQRADANDDSWEEVGFVEGHGTVAEPQKYQFHDIELKSGDYLYRLKQIDLDGAFEYSPEFAVNVGTPQTFVLHQNYPNPFNAGTKIDFELPGRNSNGSTPFELRIYNIRGELIRTFSESREAGYYSIEWDARNDRGIAAPSGVYIYRVRYGAAMEIRKMLLLR